MSSDDYIAMLQSAFPGSPPLEAFIILGLVVLGFIGVFTLGHRDRHSHNPHYRQSHRPPRR